MKSFKSFIFNTKFISFLSELSNKYYFSYKCYWSFSRNCACFFYSCIFFDYRNNKESVKDDKKEKEKSTIKFLCLLKVN